MPAAQYTLSKLEGDQDPEIASMAAEAAKKVSASMRQVPIQQLRDQLLQQREGVPDKDPELSRLDDVINLLTALISRMFTGGPYDLQDLQEINLRKEVSDLLAVKYLSEAAPPQDGMAWPVHGALFSPYQRPLVCLPTQLRPGMPCVNVFYLVDPNAPFSELSPSAFSALGSGAAPPRATRGIVNGVHCQLRLCAQDGNHRDIPVLGADYLARVGAVLTVNYKQLIISIDCPL